MVDHNRIFYSLFLISYSYSYSMHFFNLTYKDFHSILLLHHFPFPFPFIFYSSVKFSDLIYMPYSWNQKMVIFQHGFVFITISDLVKISERHLRMGFVHLQAVSVKIQMRFHLVFRLVQLCSKTLFFRLLLIMFQRKHCIYKVIRLLNI